MPAGWTKVLQSGKVNASDLADGAGPGRFVMADSGDRLAFTSPLIIGGEIPMSRVPFLDNGYVLGYDTLGALLSADSSLPARGQVYARAITYRGNAGVLSNSIASFRGTVTTLYANHASDENNAYVKLTYDDSTDTGVALSKNCIVRLSGFNGAVDGHWTATREETISEGGSDADNTIRITKASNSTTLDATDTVRDFDEALWALASNLSELTPTLYDVRDQDLVVTFLRYIENENISGYYGRVLFSSNSDTTGATNDWDVGRDLGVNSGAVGLGDDVPGMTSSTFVGGGFLWPFNFDESIPNFENSTVNISSYNGLFTAENIGTDDTKIPIGEVTGVTVNTQSGDSIANGTFTNVIPSSTSADGSDVVLTIEFDGSGDFESATIVNGGQNYIATEVITIAKEDIGNASLDLQLNISEIDNKVYDCAQYVIRIYAEEIDFAGRASLNIQFVPGSDVYSPQDNVTVGENRFFCAQTSSLRAGFFVTNNIPLNFMDDVSFENTGEGINWVLETAAEGGKMFGKLPNNLGKEATTTEFGNLKLTGTAKNNLLLGSPSDSDSDKVVLSMYQGRRISLGGNTNNTGPYIGASTGSIIDLETPHGIISTLSIETAGTGYEIDKDDGAVESVDNAGSPYSDAAGFIVDTTYTPGADNTEAQAGSGFTIRVDSIDGSGKPLTWTIITPGAGYDGSDSSSMPRWYVIPASGSIWYLLATAISDESIATTLVASNAEAQAGSGVSVKVTSVNAGAIDGISLETPGSGYLSGAEFTVSQSGNTNEASGVLKATDIYGTGHVNLPSGAIELNHRSTADPVYGIRLGPNQKVEVKDSTTSSAWTPVADMASAGTIGNLAAISDQTLVGNLSGDSASPLEISVETVATDNDDKIPTSGALFNHYNAAGVAITGGTVAGVTINGGTMGGFNVAAGDIGKGSVATLGQHTIGTGYPANIPPGTACVITKLFGSDTESGLSVTGTTSTAGFLTASALTISSAGNNDYIAGYSLYEVTRFDDTDYDDTPSDALKFYVSTTNGAGTIVSADGLFRKADIYSGNIGSQIAADPVKIFGTKTGINIISDDPDDCTSGSFKANNMTLLTSLTMEEYAVMQFRSRNDESPTGPISNIINSTIAGQRHFTLPEFSTSQSAQSKYFAVTDETDGKIGISDLVDGTDGQLITWGADGAPTTVSTGANTHVLTSNGAGSAPTFQAIPDGSKKISMGMSAAITKSVGGALCWLSPGGTMFDVDRGVSHISNGQIASCTENGFPAGVIFQADKDYIVTEINTAVHRSSGDLSSDNTADLVIGKVSAGSLQGELPQGQTSTNNLSVTVLNHFDYGGGNIINDYNYTESQNWSSSHPTLSNGDYLVALLELGVANKKWEVFLTVHLEEN